MNTREAITPLFLLVAVLAATSSLQAGSLTPPPGAPAPTMKTISEVEPSTPVNTLAGSAGAVHVISQSGSYHLTGNIAGVAAKHGIQISASYVSLDLRGFQLIGVPASLNGIHFDSAVNNISVASGIVRNWGQSGIANDPGGNDFLIRQIEAVSNNRNGIGANNMHQAIVENCTARNNNLLGAYAGIQVGYKCIVRNCTSTMNNPSAAGVTYGIKVGSSCLVSECVSSENIGTLDSYGIYSFSDCRILNNVCNNNRAGASGFVSATGIFAGSSSLVSGNVCKGNLGSVGATLTSVTGIYGGEHCCIQNNECTGNTANGTGNAVGIACESYCRVDENHCTLQTGGAGGYGIRVTGSGGTGTSVIRNTTTQNTLAGLRFDNSTGTGSFYGLNVFDEATSVSQLGSATNTAGTGAWVNVNY